MNIMAIEHTLFINIAKNIAIALKKNLLLTDTLLHSIWKSDFNIRAFLLMYMSRDKRYIEL